MPFFYRRADRPTVQRSASAARLATSVVFLAYPLGGIVQILLPDTTPQPDLAFGEALGMGLIVLALAAFCYIAPSQFQRIAGDQTCGLDEREMDLRRRAYTFSYQVMTSLALAGIIYLALAAQSDDGDGRRLWTPSEYDHWNAIFWGCLAYAFTLPTAYLAWTAPDPVDEEDGLA